jgi:hypothetical protein
MISSSLVTGRPRSSVRASFWSRSAGLLLWSGTLARRPLMALSGHAGRRLSRQLSGAKRTPRISAVAAVNDPKRTLHITRTPPHSHGMLRNAPNDQPSQNTENCKEGGQEGCKKGCKKGLRKDFKKFEKIQNKSRQVRCLIKFPNLHLASLHAHYRSRLGARKYFGHRIAVKSTMWSTWNTAG